MVKKYTERKLSDKVFEKLSRRKGITTISRGYPFIDIFKGKTKIGRYNTSRNVLQTR